MVSTPLLLISSAFSMKPGRCLVLQVGVKAPGTPTSTTFLPAAAGSGMWECKRGEGMMIPGMCSEGSRVGVGKAPGTVDRTLIGCVDRDNGRCPSEYCKRLCDYWWLMSDDPPLHSSSVVTSFLSLSVMKVADGSLSPTARALMGTARDLPTEAPVSFLREPGVAREQGMNGRVGWAVGRQFCPISTNLRQILGEVVSLPPVIAARIIVSLQRCE